MPRPPGSKLTPKELANLIKYKKGQSGNPRGKVPQLKPVGKLSAIEVAEVGSLLLGNNIAALQAIVDDAKFNPESEVTSLKAIYAQAAITAFQKGELYTLELLMNRLIGRVKQEINLSGGLEVTKIASEEEAQARAQKLMDLLKTRPGNGESGQGNPSSQGS